MGVTIDLIRLESYLIIYDAFTRQVFYHSMPRIFCFMCRLPEAGLAPRSLQLVKVLVIILEYSLAIGHELLVTEYLHIPIRAIMRRGLRHDRAEVVD